MQTARATSFYGLLPRLTKPSSVLLPNYRFHGRRLPSYSIVLVHCRYTSSDGASAPETPASSEATTKPTLPFYFEAGYAVFAKRPSRPFPPPFLSYPSGSFSDPLSTHDRSRDRRSYYKGQVIRGVTNGDDAVLLSDNFIGANDGVGAWATKDKGHAAWVLAVSRKRTELTGVQAVVAVDPPLLGPRG